ncbi:Exodeoxyribonuclease 7 large subunit [Alphaproteobacteria bacterium SO-S41]|nr:Exodeoxyribonuclease 7 large subunit [Alphaproteobacteria bacterium SO-S41]
MERYLFPMSDLPLESPGEPAPNTFEFSVSELSQALKRTVEDRFGFVRVRGEISGFRGVHSSGHAYFALKDEGAKIDAVVWRGSYSKLKVKPEEGMEVIASGRLTTYPSKSSYQIVIERLELAGIGAIMKMIEERKARLAAEGLFDAARKKPIPHLPEVIGIVTSPTGAVIRDILHRLADRFPRRVLVWPVAVQGETAAAQVAAAIRGFNALEKGGAIPRPDILIVARGGGSVEDLLPFSDEAVVRAAAESAIPLISAVGHETDTTLIDFASDRRAPTPTAAAEMAVPVRADLVAETLGLERRLIQTMARAREDRRRRIADLARGLPKPDQLLALARQRFDGASGRLGGALGIFVERARGRVTAASGRFRPALLQAETTRLADRTTEAGRRLGLAAKRRTDDAARALSQQGKLLEALSHRATLARGFALVRTPAGALKRSAGDVAAGEALVIQFHDGDRTATADGAGSPPPTPPETPPTAAKLKRATRDGGPGQGTLF